MFIRNKVYPKVKDYEAPSEVKKIGNISGAGLNKPVVTKYVNFSLIDSDDENANFNKVVENSPSCKTIGFENKR